MRDPHPLERDGRSALRPAWARPELSARDSSVLTVTALIAGGHSDRSRTTSAEPSKTASPCTELIEAITSRAFHTG